MKFLLVTGVLSLLIILVSCSKQTQYETTQTGSSAGRIVHFELYTDKDFLNDNNSIQFTLSIQKNNNDVLWDSLLPPIKASDIPSFAQRIIAEKTIFGYDTSLLKVGFYYSIENVGNSWHIDAAQPYENFKKVEFNFQ